MKILSNGAMSLLNKIITFFVGYMIIVMFCFSVMIYIVDHSSMNKINDGYSKDVVKLEATMVDTWLDDTAVSLRNLSSMVGSQEDIFKTISGLKDVQKENKDLFRHIYLVDLDYNYIDTFDQEATMKDELVQSVINGDKDVVITNPIIHPVLNEALFNIIVPIENDGAIIGALGATVTMDELSLRLGEFEVSGAGFGWLIDENQTVIAHPKEDLILKMSLLSDASIKENQLESLRLSTSSKFGFSGLDKIGEKLIEDSYYTGKYSDADGYKRIVSFAPITTMNGWLVGFTTFEDRLPTSTNSLLIYMGLALLIVVVISIITSYYLASEITKPINQLIHVTNLFINGNKGVRAKVTTTDEIGTLSKAFNGMADTIIAHTDNVEELIKERTQMLADINYQITSRNNELNTMNEELETTNTKLHSLATTDMLTGLQNRHELVRTLQGFIDDVQNGDEPGFSVLFVDLDNFKYYNDTFSHEIGDYLLIEVSAILNSNVRDLDLVARYGGDEFVILLKHGNFEMSKMISERIHAKILEQKGFKKQIERKINSEIVLLGKNMLSCSIGIVNYNKSVDAKNVEDLLALADETMYKAKKAGKSRIVVN